MRVSIGALGGGVWGRAQVGGGGWFACGNRGKSGGGGRPSVSGIGVRASSWYFGFQTQQNRNSPQSVLRANIRVRFWQNGFFTDSDFWAARFFRGFCGRICFSSFCGKSAQKIPPGKSPGESSKIDTTKIPDTFLQRGRSYKYKWIKVTVLAAPQE